MFAALSATAQLPGSAPATPAADQQSPAVTPIQTPSFDVFGGSGAVDKLVPGVVQLSLLGAIDRGMKHNLGLLLSQQQTDVARAQTRRNLKPAFAECFRQCLVRA